MNLIDEAREAYRPKDVRILFIAEAPPCAKNRFFYFPDVQTGDSLFLHVIREVFPEVKDFPVKKIRATKEELLIEFRSRGFFLEDSLENPIPKETRPQQKLQLIRGEQESLHKRIVQYRDKAKLVLLSSTVFKANYEYLKGLGYNILNKSAIPFPGSGQQTRFKEEIKKINL